MNDCLHQFHQLNALQNKNVQHGKLDIDHDYDGWSLIIARWSPLTSNHNIFFSADVDVCDYSIISTDITSTTVSIYHPTVELDNIII